MVGLFKSLPGIHYISADLMAKSGFSDAASALRLVSGTTVQDGKFAVVRGLPDLQFSIAGANLTDTVLVFNKRSVRTW